MPDFLMPTLGGDMATGTLVSWRKEVGDAVHRGDVVAEVETAKGVIEVEIFFDGVIDKFLVEPGASVPVGTPLAVVRGEGEAAATAAPVAAAPAVRLRITPAARELARTLGVDVATLKGSGPDGAVTREDVEKAGAKPTTERKSDETAAMRQSIASAMARSKREIPHYYLANTIDLTTTLAWLVEQNASRSISDRVLPGALFLKAVALALREFPDLNSVWADGRVSPKPAIHVGVAISIRQGGLVAPAIHETDKLSLTALMQKLQDLVSRARAGSVRSSEMSDPTITVTSLGDAGAESAFGVIYPPQVAIVGFGRIVERPWVVEGKVVPRSVTTVTLSADHRVTDGHLGARFLTAVERLLSEPSRL